MVEQYILLYYIYKFTFCSSRRSFTIMIDLLVRTVLNDLRLGAEISMSLAMKTFAPHLTNEGLQQ